ncbi:MAG: sulfate adenylyltransferase [Patescibacteria group bacterium]
MMNKKNRIQINFDHLLYLRGINEGSLNPLKGFCNRLDYESILKTMRFKNGYPWPIPITLEIDEEQAKSIKKFNEAELIQEDGINCAILMITDIFKIDLQRYIKEIFKTDSLNHPGVKKEIKKPLWRIAGDIRFKRSFKPISSKYYQKPDEVIKEIKKRGWNTVAGFQTRNPIHRAHEHLQRIAMEVCDGLLIQPLIGARKNDDFSFPAILESYNIMINHFYPRDKVIFTSLELPMHYAGPREAILHALIRKNYGCTHFIVGRDHAGVGNFYGRYEAQEIANSFKDLGIEILRLKSPFFCKKCAKVVSENTCTHYYSDKDSVCEINGSNIRNMINNNKIPPKFIMRKEISKMLFEYKQKKMLLNEWR